MKNNLAPITAIALLCLLWVGSAQALSTDSEQPINIEADRVDADDRKRLTVYRGKAIITQGSIRISGDTVKMYFDDQNELIKLISVGKPARFRQRPDGKKEFQRAEARRIEYYANKDRMILIDHAKASQGGDTIRADRIEYDTFHGKVKAESLPTNKAGKAPKSRVRITINPKNKKRP